MRSWLLVLSRWCRRSFRNIWSSTRIACEDARLEVVTCVVAKFGFENSWFQAEWHGCSRTLGSHGCWRSQLSLSRQAEVKGSPGPRDGCLSAVEHIFNETAMHAKARASNRMEKGKQSKSWYESEPSFSGKGKSKENKDKSNGNRKEPKVRTKLSKAHARAKHRLLS